MHYSSKYDCVIYQVPDPAHVVAAIASARRVNGSMVAVPATPFNMQLARLLGLPVPNLLDLKGYNWPAPPALKPYAHQKHMAAFHVVSPRAFNLSEMGTGKTLALLWACDFLMRQGVIQRALILAPLSTLKQVWDNEIFKAFINQRKAVVLHGSREDRLSKLRQAADFYIINHDGLGVGTKRYHHKFELGPIAQEIKSRQDINCIMVDEASAYKDGATLRTKILRQVVAEKPFLWLATGTPTPNAPTDAWSLARLAGNLQSESFQSFRGKTMRQVTQFKWIPTRGAADHVKRALSPAVRFSRAECIELPECVVTTRDVELSETQEKAYKALKKDLQVAIGHQVITAMNEAVLRTKLLQIVSGAIYGKDREVHKTDAGPRLRVLREIIDEAGAKILVFASFTSVVRMVYSELKEAYGVDSVAMVYGDTAKGARDEIFRAFEQEENPRIIVADAGTMSHGLTLVAANTVVWWSPIDRGEIYQQANDRINRPGQKNKMLIVRLASTPPEREIYRRLHEKESMQGAVLKMVESER